MAINERINFQMFYMCKDSNAILYGLITGLPEVVLYIRTSRSYEIWRILNGTLLRSRN